MKKIDSNNKMGKNEFAETLSLLMKEYNHKRKNWILHFGNDVGFNEWASKLLEKSNGKR